MTNQDTIIASLVEKTVQSTIRACIKVVAASTSPKEAEQELTKWLVESESHTS